MIINVTSWHYKLQKRMQTHPQLRGNLCDYMRGLFVAIFSALVIFFLSALVIFVLSAPLWIAFTTLDTIGTNTILLTSAAIWIIILKAVSDDLRSAYPDNFWFKRHYVRNSTPKASIFVEWIKAKKDNICPLVEYKDV